MALTPIGELIKKFEDRIKVLEKLEDVLEDEESIVYEKLALTEAVNACLKMLKTEKFWLTHVRANGMYNSHHVERCIEDSEDWYEAVFGEDMGELFVSLNHGKSEEEVQ